MSGDTDLLEVRAGSAPRGARTLPSVWTSRSRSGRCSGDESASRVEMARSGPAPRGSVAAGECFEHAVVGGQGVAADRGTGVLDVADDGVDVLVPRRAAGHLRQLLVDLPEVLAHVAPGEPDEVLELVVGVVDVALGLFGAVRVLGLADLLAELLALALR